MKRITETELLTLPLGSMVRTVWHNSKYHPDKDEYIGVIFEHKIGWEDGKTDDTRVIAECMCNDWCMTYLI